MFAPTGGRPLPPWIVNLLALALVLGTSGALAVAVNAANPNRRVLTLLTCAFLIGPALVKWGHGWLWLFLLLPWIAWLRRFQAAVLTNSGGIDHFDLLLLVPDALTLLAVLGLMMSQRWRKRIEPVEGERWLTVPLVGLIGITLLEVFNPIMGSLSAGINGVRVFTLYMGLYWVTAFVCQRESQIFAWITTTLVAVLISGLYGAYQHFVGLPDYDWQWLLNARSENQMVGDRIRIFSTFSYTSTFSHFMMFGMCCAWVAWRLRRLSLLTQLLAPLCFVIGGLGLALTFVRSSYVGFAVALVAGVVLGGSAKARLPRLVAVLGLGFALVALMPSTAGDAARVESATSTKLVAERLTSIGKGSDNAAITHRMGLWKRQFDIVWTYAPVGVGVGAGSGARFGGDLWAQATAYSESQFFTAFIELGWPGIALFLATVGGGLAYTLKSLDRLTDPDHRNVVRLSFMIQCATVITGITGGPILYTLPGCAYYWTVLGMVTAVNRIERDRAEREASSLTEPGTVKTA